MLLESGYQSATLNANGDETRNDLDLGNPGLKTNHENALASIPHWSAMLKGIPVDSPRQQLFRDFVKWCEAHQVRVVLTYPALAWFPAYEAPVARNTLQQVETFYQSLGVPVLGNPQDFMYEKRFMYDSIYHLNAAGCAIQTEKLLAMLRPYLVR